jgi:hypothetical protein
MFIANCGRVRLAKWLDKSELAAVRETHSRSRLLLAPVRVCERGDDLAAFF